MRDTKLAQTLRSGILLMMTGLVLMAAAWNASAADETTDPVIPEWRNQVIRLHVVANSDSDEDQTVKRAVRDAILDEVTPLFTGTESIEEAEAAIRQAQPRIQEAALKVLAEHGVRYGVSMEVGRFPFPDRFYGKVFLPAGEYNALKVQLGEARGANWWCVLFPPLCFVDWSTGVVLEPKAGTDGRETVAVPRDEVRALLDEEEAAEMPVRAQSVVWDWIAGKRRTSAVSTSAADSPHTIQVAGGRGFTVTKASELRKDVIDIRSGRRLGELVDVEIDEETGRITAIVVPGEAKFFGFVGAGPDLVIPWSRIRRIGPDCILVDMEGPALPG